VSRWTSDRSRGRTSREDSRARNNASSEVGCAGCGCSGAARARASARLAPVLLLLFAVALPLAGREKDKPSYGEGLAVNIPAPESEVEQAVADVAQNGVIRGTKEYNKDEFVSGAKPATSSRVFPAWTEGGKVFYKVREQALDPRNFKDSSDSGTLVVRYVVQAQGEKNAILRIDALFKEDFRHIVHQSDGSVENAEYQDIREHIDAVELMKRQNAEAEKERQEQLAKKRNRATQTDGSAGLQGEPLQSSSQPAAPAPGIREDASAPAGGTQAEGQNVSAESPTSPGLGNQSLSNPRSSDQGSSDQSRSDQGIAEQIVPAQSLEERVKNLRRQVERVVKPPGAPLKSAPFHTASSLQSLPAGTEVLVVISTPYWYGVETHEGQHGWIMRDELEQK
jgi:hypothetical protein